NDLVSPPQPLDDGVSPAGVRTGGRETGPGREGFSRCFEIALAFANMRLRVEPTVHLSDDVRVRMQLDLLDNLVMGSTPGGLSLDSSWQRQYGTLVPAQAFATTQDPPISGINSFSDSIVVRRAWAEVRNRGLGELRFGRMGAHWGLGILFNDGRGIDQDHQSDV
ncbi:MAG: TIGR04551 family protein, partial [Deltaproteobacteria bacterium]